MATRQLKVALLANLKKLERAGVKRIWPTYFLPPYENYNREVADWCRHHFTFSNESSEDEHA